MPRVKGFAMVDELFLPKTYDPSIQMLLQDHAKMKKTLEKVRSIGKRSYKNPSMPGLAQWHKAGQQLRRELANHLIKEEQVLYAMMSQYVDAKVGPLAVLLFEHEQIAKHLNLFEQKLSLLIHLNGKDKKLAAEVHEHCQNVYTTMHEHFDKEEKGGYSLAQGMLSHTDFTQMLRKFRKIAASSKKTS